MKIRRLGFNLAPLPEGELYFKPSSGGDIEVHLPFSHVRIADGHLEFEPWRIGSWCSTSLSGKDFKDMDLRFVLHPEVVEVDGIPHFRYGAPAGVVLIAPHYVDVKCVDNSMFSRYFKAAFKSRWEQGINENMFGDLAFELGCGMHMRQGRANFLVSLAQCQAGKGAQDTCAAVQEALGDTPLADADLPLLETFCATIYGQFLKTSSYCYANDLPIAGGLVAHDSSKPCVDHETTPNCFYDWLQLLELAKVEGSLGSTVRIDVDYKDDIGGTEKAKGPKEACLKRGQPEPPFLPEPD